MDSLIEPALACQGCGGPLHTSGVRGLCPACLVASTVPQTESAAARAAEGEDQTLLHGAKVGNYGRFLLLDKLGQGGMGEVWLAKDRELSRPGHDHLVALKFLCKEIRADEQALEAIRDEVLRSQDLSHPNIVRIYDLHTAGRTMPFIKMEYVDGNSLRYWLRQNPEGCMPWQMVSRLTFQLAGALRYAHDDKRIVHRDLKPGNLLLHRGQTLKLSDFGIAEPITGVASGRITGTLAYASPQQLAGDAPAPADDIYALGATLYELLTGTLPFDGQTPDELIYKAKFYEPDPIPQRLEALGRRNRVPIQLLVLVQKCLDKEPDRRPKTAVLPNLLPPTREEAPIIISQPSEAEFEEPSPPPKSRAWPVLLFTLLLLAGIGGWAWYAHWPALDRLRQLLALNRPPSGEGTSAALSPNNGQQTNTPDAPPTPYTNFPTKPLEEGQEPPTHGPSGSASEPAGLEGSGRVSLALLGTARVPHWYGIFRDQTNRVLAGTLVAGQTNFSTALKPGTYRFVVGEGGKYLHDSSVLIQNGESVLVKVIAGRVLSGWENLRVSTEPAQALVTWSQDQLNGTSSVAPFNRRFAIGEHRFKATHFGYFPLETNYYFDPAISTNLVLVLQKSPHPLEGEDWTNSLQMRFHWVEALHLWACVAETRVSDFSPFMEAAHCEPSEMASVTPTGVRKSGFNWRNPGPAFGQTPDHPVVGVNYQDAVAFCQWLTERERKDKGLTPDMVYRLPSTNEWFALAGRGTFPWGESPVALAGNYSGKEVLHQAGSHWPSGWPIIEWYEDSFPRTAPVYSMRTNALGLYHLGGNVAEWCQEQVLCGHSWKDGEALAEHKADDKKAAAELNYLATEQVEAADPRERTDWRGFRVILSSSRAGASNHHE